MNNTEIDVELNGKASLYIRETLYQKYGKELTAEVIVEDATKKTSPLHKYFEWDDSKAAHEYRLEKARSILRRVTMTLTETMDDGKQKEFSVRLFHCLTSSKDTTKKTYQALPEILKSEDKKDELLEQCSNDLRAWRNKYRNIAGVIKIYEDGVLTIRALRTKA